MSKQRQSINQALGPMMNTAGIWGTTLTETRAINPAGTRPMPNLWCSEDNDSHQGLLRDIECRFLINKKAIRGPSEGRPAARNFRW